MVRVNDIIPTKQNLNLRKYGCAFMSLLYLHGVTHLWEELAESAKQMDLIDDEFYIKSWNNLNRFLCDRFGHDYKHVSVEDGRLDKLYPYIVKLNRRGNTHFVVCDHANIIYSFNSDNYDSVKDQTYDFGRII